MKRIALLLATTALLSVGARELHAACCGKCPYPIPCSGCGAQGYARGYPRAVTGAGDWGYFPSYQYGLYGPGRGYGFNQGYKEYLSSGGGVGYNPNYYGGYRAQFFGASRASRPDTPAHW